MNVVYISVQDRKVRDISDVFCTEAFKVVSPLLSLVIRWHRRAINCLRIALSSKTKTLIAKTWRFLYPGGIGFVSAIKIHGFLVGLY